MIIHLRNPQRIDRHLLLEERGGAQGRPIVGIGLELDALMIEQKFDGVHQTPGDILNSPLSVGSLSKICRHGPPFFLSGKSTVEAQVQLLDQL